LYAIGVQKVHERSMVLFAFVSVISGAVGPLSPVGFFPLLNGVPVLSADDYFSSRRFSGARLALSFDSTTIECCSFIGIYSPDQCGGAVMTFGPLSIFNSLFKGCKGRDGGGVACHACLLVTFSTFLQCSASQSGGIDLRNHDESESVVNVSELVGCKASYFGSFYRLSDGMFGLESVNISKSEADQCVGTAEVKAGKLRIARLRMTASRATSHNGGMCLRQLVGVEIEASVFEQCGHVSAELEAAAVLLVYMSPENGMVRQCAFIDNNPDRTTTVTVCSGKLLKMIECCFTGTAEREVKAWNADLVECRFEAKDCPTKLA
jgi:hypothetical protein